MSTFQVPQFLDTKTKILGPLTPPQFFYLAGSFTLTFICLKIFKPFFAFILGLIFVTLGIAFAFLKINGQTFDKIFIAALKYLLQPKTFIWQREISKKEIILPSDKEVIDIRKNLSLEQTFKNLVQKLTISNKKNIKPETKEKYQVIRQLTGEEEIAKRVDYL